MAIFSLEALDARSGDALFLHYGDPTQQLGLIVVDGGFVATYNDRLKKRLQELRADALLADHEPLPIEQVIVTHIDRDHISGIARMFRDLRDDHAVGDPPPWRVKRLWHNSFADVMAATTGDSAVSASVTPRVKEGAAGLSEGRELRDYAEVLGLDGNPPFGGLVVSPATLGFDAGLSMTLVGPPQARLDQLKAEWEADVVPAPTEARIAAFVDNSVPNLSSIAMLATMGGRSMLLTGDARGDDTLAALDDAGLTDAQRNLKVDILKVPHHGSIHNLERSYFERIVADHYVISANGVHHNPDHEALELLVGSQGDRVYTIYLTNESDTTTFFADDQANNTRNYDVVIRPDDAHSIIIDLADPF